MNSIDQQTVLTMIERDVMNKYDTIKNRLIIKIPELSLLLSTILPSLAVFLNAVDVKAIEKLIDSKAKQNTPKVQTLVNACVAMSFIDPDTTIDDGYTNSKQLINNSLDELIKSKSSLNLEYADQILQLLIGSKLSF